MTTPLLSADQTPTEVLRAVTEAGPTHWEDLHPSDRGSLGLGKLRLIGVYDDRFEGTFMLRIRIPGGRITAAQLEVVASIVEDISIKPEGSEEQDRFAEVTTRQDLQLHWIRFEHLGEVFRRFETVGLGSLEAAGNSMRNVTSCPIDGIDPDAVLDVGPVVESLEVFARSEERLTAFLPRKFKVAVTGCRTDCVVARVNCLAFTPASLEGRTGFNVHIGGGLSDYPRLASIVDLFVEPLQVVAVVRAALQTFAALGDYEHASVNRFRALVHELGPDRVGTEIRARLPFEAAPSGKDLSTWAAEDHIGVRPDRHGTSYVGLCVPVGRVTGAELAELARLASTYGDGRLRLTQRQNVVLTGVRDVDALLAEPLCERLRAAPDPFERAVVACTSAPFCKFGILAMKPYGVRLIEQLRQRVPEAGWARLEGLRLHLSGCKASCAQVPLAHIGLRATMGKHDTAYFDAFDIALGGDAGAARLASWAQGGVEAMAAFEAIVALLNDVANGDADLASLTADALEDVEGSLTPMWRSR
jgi:ferredoxin-nitrite reductase